jgi:hypothetical protein
MMVRRLKGTDTLKPYTCMGFHELNNGTHNWTAKAYDTAGNSRTSMVVSLVVNIRFWRYHASHRLGSN